MPQTGPGPTGSVVPLDRVKAFSDGVLAIVITILVLDLEGPEPSVTRADVSEYLHQLRSQLHPYFASFVLTGTFWIQHSVMLKYVRRCDRGLAWLNVLFLLPLTLLPFLTGVRATHPSGVLAEGSFGAGLVLASLGALAMWQHATRGHRLIAPTVDPAVIRSMGRRTLAIAGLSVAGAVGSVVNTYLGTVIFICIPMLLVSHKTVDQAAVETGGA